MDAARRATFENNLKIERLLDPLTRTRRDALFRINGKLPEDLNSIHRPAFVHYTSAEAALSIIKNKYMWMRNTRCMEDWSEIQYGHNVLVRYFAKETRDRAFTEACDAVGSHFAQRIKEIYKYWSNPINFQTYIISVSEHSESENQHGRLSMWRAFGGKPSRVALVFRPKFITGVTDLLHAHMRPVLYENEGSLHEDLDSVVNNIKTERDFFASLPNFCEIFASTLINRTVGWKHSAFAEEREWRIIFNPLMPRSTSLTKSVVCIGGTPQIVYHFPIGSDPRPELKPLCLTSMFERLIIGPTVYGQTMCDAFIDTLTEAGVEGAQEKIIISGIPLR